MLEPFPIATAFVTIFLGDYFTASLRRRAALHAVAVSFRGAKRSQPPRKFVPDLCQSIADLDVLDDLVKRNNSNLRVINGSRGTDSVPGHLFQ
jgi:hypothetical protein